MNKVKILIIIAICLLAINIFWICFFLSHKPPHGRRKEPKKLIIEKLRLEETQTSKYENLIAEHRVSIGQLEQQIGIQKNKLYLSLREEEKPSIVDSLVAEIGKNQMEMEHINYKHFQDIKKLCKPEQQISFGELCSEISNLFTPSGQATNEKH